MKWLIEMTSIKKFSLKSTYDDDNDKFWNPRFKMNFLAPVGYYLLLSKVNLYAMSRVINFHS